MGTAQAKVIDPTDQDTSDTTDLIVVSDTERRSSSSDATESRKHQQNDDEIEGVNKVEIVYQFF